MAGPITVLGPDGQRYQFPEGTDPAVMKQAMAKRYPPSGAPQAAPPTSASPFLQRGMNMVSGAQATPPRQPAAWEAGAREYVANMPERERAGILSSGDAALFNIANTLTAGGLQRAGNQVVPGKNLGDAAMQEGESYYPTASVVGRGVAYAAPAGVGGRVANMAAQDLITATGARNLVPKAISEGTDALARGTRYLGRLGTMAPTGALQVGAYEGIVEQPVRDFMAGEESTVGGRVRAGVSALANPINYGVLPVASAAGRVGKALLTGVAAPGDVQRAVTAGSRGAVPLSEGQFAADAAQILDAQAMSAIDPRGFKLVERILRQSGLSDSDIPAVNAKVRELLEAAPDAVASRLTIGQVYAKALYDLDKTQASENILKVLRERRNVTDVKDRSPSIVGDEVRDLRGSQVDFITQSAESNLGAGKRIDVKNAVAETKKQIGAEYNRVLAEADPTRPEARGISMIVMGDASAPGILKRRAENAGFESVEAYVAARPDEAGHWLRSSLAKAARGASGREKIELETTVGQLDELLDTNAGYAQARQQYGTEIGVDEARDIGSNFIAAARNQGNLDLLLEQIAALPPRQRDVALLSIRDNLLAPVRGSGEDAPARISQLVSVGTLEGLQRLGPTGKALADDIRAIRDENQFLGQIDSGNPLRQSATFSNADAAANAPDLYSGGIARTLNAGGGSSLPADIAISAITGTPIAPFTLAKIARGGLQSVFAPGRKSKEAMTQFLMTRPRNAGGPVPPPAGGPPPQAPRTVGVAPAMAAPAGAPVPPQAPASPAMAAPVMPPHVPILSSGSVPARSGPPPFPPPLEAMEWTGPIPREPGGLLAFIRKLGGIREEFGRFQEQGYMRGSVEQLLGDVRSRPGLLNNKSGQTIDELARSARDAGFDIGDDEDFMRQLANELQGRGKSYRIGEAEEWNAYQDFLRNKKRAESSERIYNEIPFGFGIGPNAQAALQQSAFGSIGGSAYGNFNDVNQDGVIDQQDVYAGAVAGGVGLPATVKGAQVASDFMPAPRAAPRVAPDAMPAGGYFGRQSMRPPGSGPSPREIEIQQQWSTATPIVTQARTTAQTAQQAAEAALQSKAPADIARAKAEKKALVGQLQEAQASRAGMNTPEDARLAETLASLTENTSDPVLLSTQISAAKTSLDRLLTDIGSPVEGNLIPVKTNILTRTQAPRSAAEGPQDRPSVTRYAEGGDEVKPQGFGAGGSKTPTDLSGNNLITERRMRQDVLNLEGERAKLRAEAQAMEDAVDYGSEYTPDQRARFGEIDTRLEEIDRLTQETYTRYSKLGYNPEAALNEDVSLIRFVKKPLDQITPEDVAEYDRVMAGSAPAKSGEIISFAAAFRAKNANQTPPSNLWASAQAPPRPPSKPPALKLPEALSMRRLSLRAWTCLRLAGWGGRRRWGLIRRRCCIMGRKATLKRLRHQIAVSLAPAFI
jgi:hypothetical protein